MSGTSSDAALLGPAAESTELLRLVACGSVDDGKSTLIGRLLFDTKQVMSDQLEHVEETSERRGDGFFNLALLTDGLRAEREQGITIDVAYRSFVTPSRRFQLADAPGHVQYTRNMVTGASTADVAVVLVDARKGVIEQTQRHTYIAAMLGIPHVVFAVNKMDLVEFDEGRFRAIENDLRELSERLGLRDATTVPIAARPGDNVVEPSDRLAWWGGGTFLEHLESIELAADRDASHRRFPVQWVIRPMSDEHHDYRGYAGQVSGGEWRAGDEVLVLPSGLRTTVAAVETRDGPLPVGVQGQAVVVRLTDEIDVSRGDMLCDPDDAPTAARELEARVCWMSERPVQTGARLAVKHTTRWARAILDEVVSVLDVSTLEQVPADGLVLNDLARVRLRLAAPLLVDPYAENRTTGAFILVDEATNETVGAGMVLAASA
ncbi:sulfate adenylyltransferase subunit 1 [Gaiella sp.]|uniref:sulfate adenylyltransferase subunit 1 n=1 Tax=Gaiella sp. TaxID=2663207 RepID=UPI002BA22A39|nr:GTP-binding protein [Gaiella sp.]HWO80103.1 GTP-binding protein [Gaiella sp.]